MREKVKKVLRYWIPIAFVSTLLCGLVYGVVQQSYRMSANDPQIQIAEDTASSLANGLSPNSTGSQVDISKSLAPFIITYDDSGKVLVSQAVLNGQTPQLPSGVFDSARNTEDRFTWQPQTGVRIAAVVTHFSGKNSGFILAGRNIREIEKREDQLQFDIIMAWFIIISSSLFVSFISL